MPVVTPEFSLTSSRGATAPELAGPPAARPWLLRGGGLVLAAVYLLAAYLSRLLSETPHLEASYWLPSGIFLGALLLANPWEKANATGAVIVGDLLFNALGARWPLALWALVMGGKLAAGHVGAFLVQKYVARRPALVSFAELLGLVIPGAGVGQLLSATAGTIAVWRLNHASLVSEVWRAWYFSDLLGVILMAPLVLVWQRGSSLWCGCDRPRWRQEAALLALGVVASAAAIGLWPALQVPIARFAMLPFVLWASVRFGPRGVTVLNFVVALLAGWFVLRGLPLTASMLTTVQQRNMYLQLELFMMAMFGLVPAILLAAQRRTEAELRESEERFASAFRACPVPIVISRRRDLVTMDVNDAFLGLFGLTRAAVIGHRLAESSWLGAAGVRALAEQVAAPPGTVSFEGRASAAGGRPVDISLAGRLVQLGGEPCLLASLVDMTERNLARATLEKSEARFRQVVETIHEVFWVLDLATGQIVYISPGFEGIWGRTCAELYGSTTLWAESIHPDDRERVQRAAATQQVAGQYDVNYRIVRPDGAVRWVRDRAFPVREADAGVRHLVGVAEDITERKKLEEQFLQSQRMEAVGTLASGLAHDLNNILTPVLIVTGVLKESAAGIRDREMLSLVENSARRGAAIVRQLLMYSRGQPSERTRVQLRQVVNEIAQMGRETFPPNIAIAVASAPDLWPVEASPTELYQVVLNLCVNARDAMPDGGVLTLTLDHASRAQPARSADSTPKGKWVRLVVQDTGSGIPPEILSRIFDPFFTTKAIGKGSGLGLSTAAGIVKGHGGEIRVESQPGRGTRFEVILPAWTDDSAEQGTVPLPAARPERATLLFIDRSAAVRESLSQFLEGHGYQVLQAESGADAPRVLAAGGPRLRLIITDTALTGSAGPDLIRQLRSAAPAIPVVATSSLATAAAREEMLAAGAAEILIQPMPPAALLRVVREVLARSAP